VAVVGGLAFSQLITLYITPVVYTYLDALRARGASRAEVPGRIRSPAVQPEPGDD
jgi:hypothetical protein